MSPAAFEVRKAPYEKFFWRLKDEQNNILAFSEVFDSKKQCIAAIERTRNYAKDAEVVDLAPTWE